MIWEKPSPRRAKYRPQPEQVANRLNYSPNHLPGEFLQSEWLSFTYQA